jgi:hypothetical protein
VTGSDRSTSSKPPIDLMLRPAFEFPRNRRKRLKAWEEWKKDNWKTEPSGSNYESGETTVTHGNVHEEESSRPGSGAGLEKSELLPPVRISERSLSQEHEDPLHSSGIGGYQTDEFYGFLDQVNELKDLLNNLDSARVLEEFDAHEAVVVERALARIYQMAEPFFHSEDSPWRSDLSIWSGLQEQWLQLAELYDSARIALHIYIRLGSQFEASRNSGQAYRLKQLQEDLQVLVERRIEFISAARSFSDVLDAVLTVLSQERGSKPSTRPSSATGTE